MGDMNNTINQFDLTYMEWLTQQQNTQSFEIHIGHSAKQTKWQAIKQVSTTLKEVKLYRVLSPAKTKRN